MKRLFTIFACLVCFALTGCGTSQVVTLASMNPPKDLHSAALVFQDGNNSDMTVDIVHDLRDRGIEVKPPLPAGVRQAQDVDMLVTYSDKWRWDIVMYLKSLDLSIFDAKSGNLIVTGRWENSPLHGFQDSKKVIKELLDEMMQKVRDAIPKTP